MNIHNRESGTRYYAPGLKRGWTPVFAIYRNKIVDIFYIYNVGKSANKGLIEMNKKTERKKSS